MSTLSIDDAIRNLNDAVRDLDVAVRVQKRETAFCPRTTADIEAAIEEWCAADEDASAHFDRFPNSMGVAHKDTSPETQADWSRCCERMQVAKEALVAVARALREASKSDAARADIDAVIAAERDLD